MSTSQLPELGPKSRDTAVATVRAVLGAVPYVGPALAEVVGYIIPGQRLDRLEQYAVMLAERLRQIESKELAERLKKPESVDLFEEGALQSARALSEERKQYIASLVARGISGEETARLEAKRLLNLLRELDDAEIISLARHLGKYSGDASFWERNTSVLEPVGASIQSSQAEMDAETIQKAVDSHLSRMGLIKPRFSTVRRNEIPEFDQTTGLIKAHGAELTPLGLMLLRQIGLSGEDDV